MEDKDSQNNHMKAIKEYQSQISLFMKLENDQYNNIKLKSFKGKSILDLVVENIGQGDNVGLICSTFVNETLLHYDEILEKIIIFEVTGASQNNNQYYAHKLLPLGRDNENLDATGTYYDFWTGVKKKMNEDDFLQFCSDEKKYLKVIKACLKKNRKNINYIYYILENASKRKICQLNLLFFDFKMRCDMNLPPSERYDLEKACNNCSQDTFQDFITKDIKLETDSSALLNKLKAFHMTMDKFINSKGIVIKEFFALFESFILKNQLKILNNILSELLEERRKTQKTDPYEFFNSVCLFL